MRRVALLATVAALAAAQPVGADVRQPPPAADPTRFKMTGTLHVQRRGANIDIGPARTSLRRVVENAVSERSLRALPAALRTYLESASPRFRLAATRPSATVRYGEPAGDLDGDRLGDVLEIEAQVPSLRPVRMTARRGVNGRVLWSTAITADAEVVPLAVGDLSGDGAGDVLTSRFDVLDVQGAGSCAIAVCGEGGGGTYRWTISLLSGHTGQPLWARTYDGQIVFSAVDTEATAGEAVFATNGLVIPFVSADHDGDRRPDLVLDAFDAIHLGTTSFAGVLVDAPATLIATHASVVSGRTGVDVLTREQPMEPGGAFLLPSADATGDRRGDLLWQNALIAATPATCAPDCFSEARSRVEVEMIDGARLEPAWSVTLNDADLQDAIVIPADADPTADGRADVYLYRARRPLGAAASFTVGAMSGADGRIAWSVEADPDGSVDAIGRPKGVRGDDVLLSSFAVLSPPETQPLRVALHLDRRDGRTGRRRLRTTHVFEDTKTRAIALIESFVLGDGDADRVADVVVDALYHDSDLHDLASLSWVESGRTGARVWSRRANGLAIAQPAGDATSDGSADVLDVRLDEDDIALSVLDLSPVRRISRRVDPAPDGFLALAGPDQTGRGGDDQVYSRLRVVPSGFFSRLDALDSRTGRFSWGTGHRLPARPRGKIAGVVRDTAGRGIAEICAVAYKLDGTAASQGASSSNGSYHVGRLADGKYKVRFADCGVQRYRMRWYKQQSDMRSANVVTVKNGSRTSGINAVLMRS